MTECYPKGMSFFLLSSFLLQTQHKALYFCVLPAVFSVAEQTKSAHLGGRWAWRQPVALLSRRLWWHLPCGCKSLDQHRRAPSVLPPISNLGLTTPWQFIAKDLFFKGLSCTMIVLPPKRVRSVSGLWTYPNESEDTVKPRWLSGSRIRIMGLNGSLWPQSGGQWCGSRTCSPGEAVKK